MIIDTGHKAHFFPRWYSIKGVEYDSTDDGPEVNLINIERLNVVLDYADERMRAWFLNC